MRLAIRKSEGMDDWYVIERAEHDGRSWMEPIPGIPNAMALHLSSRFSDADVEGTADEMLGIAEGIETRDGAGYKRCAVRIDGDRAFFQSPRNSQREGECSLAEADALAKEIRATLSVVDTTGALQRFAQRFGEPRK